MIETMPQSKEVEDFIKVIGPFYEFVEDEEQVKETETKNETNEQNHKEIKTTKQVTFDAGLPSTIDDQDDDDGELEFQDSYDNLPTSTPPCVRNALFTYIYHTALVFSFYN